MVTRRLQEDHKKITRRSQEDHKKMVKRTLLTWSHFQPGFSTMFSMYCWIHYCVYFCLNRQLTKFSGSVCCKPDILQDINFRENIDLTAIPDPRFPSIAFITNPTVHTPEFTLMSNSYPWKNLGGLDRDYKS
ncbi:YALIA101S15e01970g1_1 [Yarrowia lipolytica]|nr:YALIA101S15e01970g1_1 [Yarrowia lipolytica]